MSVIIARPSYLDQLACYQVHMVQDMSRKTKCTPRLTPEILLNFSCSLCFLCKSLYFRSGTQLFFPLLLRLIWFLPCVRPGFGVCSHLHPYSIIVWGSSCCKRWFGLNIIKRLWYHQISVSLSLVLQRNVVLRADKTVSSECDLWPQYIVLALL